MEPLKIKVITDTTYTHVNRRLGPSLNRVWKVEISNTETSGGVGSITIQRDESTQEAFNTVGTAADPTDVNSGQDTEIWLLNGEYIQSWTKLTQVKIYEYNGYRQIISESSERNTFDYMINDSSIADFSGTTAGIDIWFGITGSGTAANDPNCSGTGCELLPRYEGATHANGLPSDLVINYISPEGEEIEVYPISTSSGYTPYYLWQDSGTSQKLEILFYSVFPLNALEQWDYSYCYETGTGDGSYYILTQYWSDYWCNNAGHSWYSGTNNFTVSYPDGSTGGITSKEFMTSLPEGIASSSSSSSSSSHVSNQPLRPTKVSGRNLLRIKKKAAAKKGLKIKTKKFRP